MDDAVAGFKVEKAKRLSTFIDSIGSGTGSPSSVPEGPRTAIAYTHSGTIPARSGTTVGSGVATLYRINSSNVLEAVTDSASANIVVTVKNLSTSVVGASKYIQIKREYYSGQWFVDFEDC